MSISNSTGTLITLNDLIASDEIDVIFPELPPFRWAMFVSQLSAEGIEVFGSKEERQSLIVTKNPEVLQQKFAPALKALATKRGIPTDTPAWVRFLSKSPKELGGTTSSEVRAAAAPAPAPAAPKPVRTPVTSELAPPQADYGDDDAVSEEMAKPTPAPKRPARKAEPAAAAPAAPTRAPDIDHMMEMRAIQADIAEKMSAMAQAIGQQQTTLTSILNKVLNVEVVNSTTNVQVDNLAKLCEVLVTHVGLLTTIIAKTGMATTGMDIPDLVSDAQQFSTMLMGEVTKATSVATGKDRKEKRKEKEPAAK